MFLLFIDYRLKRHKAKIRPLILFCINIYYYHFIYLSLERYIFKSNCLNKYINKINL